jgi:hypothetical protein
MPEATQVQPYSADVAASAAAGAELQQQAEALVITTDDDDLAAKTLLADVRSVLKDAEAKRKEVKEPYLRVGKEIDEAFKTAAAPWKAAETALVGKTGTYHKQKIEAEQAALRERERLEREAVAAEAARRAASPMMVDGQPLPAPAPVDLPPAPAPVATTTKTAAGDVSMVAHRGFQIVDESEIPREYLVPDRVKIGEVYRKGGDVAGCVEDVTYTPRARR